jgi:hypothetical protein
LFEESEYVWEEGALYIFKRLWFEVAWNVFVADRFLTNRSVADNPQFVRIPRRPHGPRSSTGPRNKILGPLWLLGQRS